MGQLYQNDSRWKDNKIGLQNSYTISQVGCLLTSLAMVVNHYGGNVTPASLNDIMKASGGFNGAWIKSAQVPGAFPQLGMKRQKWVQCDNTPAPIDWVDQGLVAGSLIVVRVDWSADPGIQGHWVVIHAKEGDDYLIWDPWQQTGAPNKLTERYGFASKNPADIILEAIWHGKGDLAAPALTTEAPASTSVRKNVTAAKQAASQTAPLAVKPLINQLSLREQPVSGAIQKLLSSSDVLLVIESGDGAKIGQANQWLHVRTSDGREGYVAAWFVQQTEAPNKTSQPETSPANDVVVQTSVNQVSFRSQPVVSTNTFIRTLAKGTELSLVDPGDEVKVGQQRQWLKVRVEDGSKGYVAAWLVSKK